MKQNCKRKVKAKKYFGIAATLKKDQRLINRNKKLNF